MISQKEEREPLFYFISCVVNEVDVLYSERNKQYEDDLYFVIIINSVGRAENPPINLKSFISISPL